MKKAVFFGVIASILIPGAGLMYSVIRNRELKKTNVKLASENERLSAQADALRLVNDKVLSKLDKLGVPRDEE